MRLRSTVPIVMLASAVLTAAFLVRPSPGADLRRFSPQAVAGAETRLWRSYYDHRRLALFLELASLLREQYGFAWFQSQVSAYHAARAAVVFQNGHSRSEYERALPDLAAYYRSIRQVNAAPFDASEAARRELEWWIVHRERDRYGKDALIRALQDLQVCLYRLPPDRFREHSVARAEAMRIRDDRATHGALTDGDWARISRLLDDSWTSLWQAVQSPAEVP